MEIRLKEAEIREAVRAYVATQGINLAGKAVDIKFTATRGDAGIVAEIDITNASEVVVEVTEPVKAPEVTKPALRGVSRNKSEDKSTQEIAQAAMNAPLEDAAEPSPETKDEPTTEVAAEDPAPAKSTTSLFG